MQADFETAAFDRYVIDTKRRRLLKDGTPVRLDARAFDLLEYLIIRRADDVPHADILAAIWPGRIVSDGNVSVQLNAVRRALDCTSRADPIILTLTNRRYRFVAPVTLTKTVANLPAAQPTAEREQPGQLAIHEDTDPPGRKQNKFLGGRPAIRRIAAISIWAAILAGLVGAAVLKEMVPAVPRLRIVVLPFENRSNDPNLDRFTDAITDDLIADLSHIPAARVISRESAGEVKNKTTEEIRDKLHVRYILAGYFLPQESGFHVSAHLTDAETDADVWTRDFDEPRDRMSINLQNIVRQIASPLHPTLDQLETARATRDRPNNPDSIDKFFQARSLLDWQNSLHAFTAAQDLLESAISRQPDFTDAKAELGWMLLRKVTILDDPDEDADYAEAKKLVEQAVQASPQNVKALAARARRSQIEGHCNAATQYADRAKAIEPSNVDARTVLAACALADLRFDDAAAEYETILDLDPAGPNNISRYIALGTIRLIQKRYGEAIKLLSRTGSDEIAAADDMGPVEQSRLMLIAAEELNGQHAKAKEDYDAYSKRFPNRTVFRISTYLPRRWLPLDGVSRLLAALHGAGMQDSAAEPAPGITDGSPCLPGDFALTPAHLPAPGKTLDTLAVRERLARPVPPIIIDVGHGIAPLPGSYVFDPTGDESRDQFVLRVATKYGGSAKTIPIMLLGDGPTGCAAYDDAKGLIQENFPDVSWYRGGEDAWSEYSRLATLKSVR